MQSNVDTRKTNNEDVDKVYLAGERRRHAQDTTSARQKHRSEDTEEGRAAMQGRNDEKELRDIPPPSEGDDEPDLIADPGKCPNLSRADMLLPDLDFMRQTKNHR